MTDFRDSETRGESIGLRVHGPGAIEAALKSIGDHKAGLPELVKNSAGAYHRLALDTNLAGTREDRVIVLLFRSPRGRGRGAIGCLDLAGMTSVDIDLFQQWFDPNAASRGDPSGELWGGHGNGAKSYLLKLFDNRWFATVRDGFYTRMGLRSESYEIEFVPSRAEADAVSVPNSLDILDQLLSEQFRCRINDLPATAQEILSVRPNWTCFVGSQSRSWNHAPARLAELLSHSPQALRAIEYASVYAVSRGTSISGGARIELEPIPAIPGGGGTTRSRCA